MSIAEWVTGIVTAGIIGVSTLIALGLCWLAYKDAKRNDETYKF